MLTASIWSSVQIVFDASNPNEVTKFLKILGSSVWLAYVRMEQ